MEFMVNKSYSKYERGWKGFGKIRLSTTSSDKEGRRLWSPQDYRIKTTK